MNFLGKRNTKPPINDITARLESVSTRLDETVQRLEELIAAEHHKNGLEAGKSRNRQ